MSDTWKFVIMIILVLALGALLPFAAAEARSDSRSISHAHRAGELVSALGGHPSLGIGPLLETHRHDIGDILRESLEHERQGLDAYRSLLKIAEGKAMLLEEYARELIAKEELHLAEVDKMLRRPGDIGTFAG